ncbi:VVA0879 family protein [Nocardiopsis synnemataformans]|uniref:VVA0879 family protein n=1 Tax=Nocardiopsis synnemataformans TaxID=61305 RepID=UPI003EBA544F
MTSRALTQDEFAAEARARFGPDPLEWAFQCPYCHDVATGRDFTQALDINPRTHPNGDPVTGLHVMGQHCIGRELGALNDPPTHTRGCSSAAYGFFPGPWTVLMPDGENVHAFPFAHTPE